MKKLLKTLVLIFTLTMCFSANVFANGSAIGSGTGGGAGEGSQDKKDGFLATKSGYIVYTSDASGNATSDVVAFCWNGGSPYSTTGAPIFPMLNNRFGQKATFHSEKSAPWAFPPFSGSSGAGGAIKSWLLNTPYGGFEKGMDYVMSNILGFSDAQIEAWYEDENNRLNVEPFIFGGLYRGSSASSFGGVVLVGSTTDWARATDSSNYGSTYTHRNLPNSLAHDILVYPQYPVPSDISSKHDSGTILANAYGIVTVKPVKGIQVVKIYKTDGVVDQTSYGFGEPPINVKDEGDYKVTKWSTSKQKTKATSTKADWGEVVAGCELVQSGSGVAVVDMPPSEKAIFILLEREKKLPDVNMNSDAIRAHELNVVFRYMDSKRDETAGAGRSFEGVNFKFSDVKHQYEKHASDTIKDYKIDDKYKVLEGVAGDTATCGRPDHYYNDVVGFYLPWEEPKEWFTHGQEIDPHYSVNVSRVAWEPNLHTVEYRDEAGMNGYAEEVLGITPSLIGEETPANPGVNVENTLPNVQTNTYDFKTSLWHEWDERSVDWVEEVEDEETGEVIDTITHYTPWVHKREEINHPIANYSINTYCDKFKVMVTPQASVASAGTVLEELRGNTVLGHDAITKQIVSTQLGGTLTFYPEVPMVVWYTSDLVNYAEPELQPIFILGEYGRKCVAPVLHGYTTGVTNGGMKGVTNLPASATGRVAENVYDYYTNTGVFINGVTAMGSTFETATSSKYTMVIGTAVFDCVDEYGVESAWKNDWVDPKGSHSAYEASITSRLDQQLILQFFDGGKKKHGDYYVLTADYEDIEISPVQEKVVVLEWKEGAVQNIGEVYDGINWAMGVSNGADLYAKWGVDEMLNTMYISTTDAKDENASGNDLSADSPLGRANPWFDEESITMCIRFYRTDVTCGCLIGDEKVDYNLLQQSNIHRYDRKNTDPENSLEARIYARLYLIGEEPSISADGYTFEHTSTFRCDEVQDARFAVVNSTTAQSRK